jgi:predicted nuclease with TOPRIM domain
MSIKQTGLTQVKSVSEKVKTLKTLQEKRKELQANLKETERLLEQAQARLAAFNSNDAALEQEEKRFVVVWHNNDRQNNEVEFGKRFADYDSACNKIVKSLAPPGSVSTISFRTRELFFSPDQGFLSDLESEPDGDVFLVLKLPKQ